jgi:sugar transferase EpsL
MRPLLSQVLCSTAGAGDTVHQTDYTAQADSATPASQFSGYPAGIAVPLEPAGKASNCDYVVSSTSVAHHSHSGIGTLGMSSRFYVRYGKRILDLLLTIPAVVVLSPLIVLVAVLVRLKLGSPVTFKHQRPGLHGRPFTLYKFRTMTAARDPEGNLLPDAQRLTPFGLCLRSASLDELPELFHVLKGDMSLVGPRPLLMEYLERYTPEQARRHEVKPGITGWAQINGRNAITWEEKFALDVWYVDNLSLWLDLKIISLTVWKVLRREGINQPGQATAQEFMEQSENHMQATG